MVFPLTSSDNEFLNRVLPYQSHFIDIAGFQMHYLDEGPRVDSAVILLHGNPTWCFYYRNLIEALREGFRVIAPDYIGCGLSDRPRRRRFRAAQRIAHLEEFVTKLGLKRFSLVMHDWGGAIGTRVALNRIDSVEKLVYLNTTLTETESLPRVIKTAAKPLIGKFFTKYTLYFVKLATTPGLGVYRKLPKEVRRGYFYPYQGSSRRSAIWDFVADIPFDENHPTYHEMLALAGELPRFSHVPVQIVWGLRDPCFHREMLGKVAEHFPHASILEIPDASHLVLEDAPEQASQTIRRFLAEPVSSQTKAREAPLSPLEESGLNILYREFLRRAQDSPHSDAVIVPSFFFDTLQYRRATFRDLSALVAKYQRGLKKLGLEAGDRVLMLVPPGLEFLALSYALFASGATAVFLDPGMGLENLLSCIRLIKPHALIGSPKAQLLRLKKKDLFPELKFHLTASDWAYTGGPNLSFLKKFLARPLIPEKAPETAMIVFTSGATGTPKGVVYTNEMLAEVMRIFRAELGLQEGKRDLPLLPIFSLFSLALGICSVFPPVDPAEPLSLEPDKVMRIIEDLGVDTSFGSPTLWNKIAEYCVRTRANFSSLKKIFMAGAPVPRIVLQRVGPLLGGGEAYVAYGATEALPVSLVSAREVLSREVEPALSGEVGVFLGKNVKGVRMKVISPSGETLSPYHIGEVVVQGSNVSPSYYESGAATGSAKIKDGPGFWHRMGDMGYLDRDGNLYFCGREAHVVKFDTRIYYSIPVERIFNQHEKVKRSALVSIDEGRDVGVVVEPHPQFWPESDSERETFRKELLALGVEDRITEKIRNVFFHPSFPVDSRHNAKIFRDKLSVWASKHLYEQAA